MKQDYLEHDRAIWEGIFREIPPEWYEAPPSDAMIRCRDFFTTHPVQRLLDLGCGFGRWVMMLAADRDVVGVDYAVEGVRAASQWGMRKRARAQFVAASALALPFQPGVFDGILVALLLDNLSQEDLGKVMGDVNRVVRPASPGFFVFNPYLTEEDAARTAQENPTKDCMHVAYRDEDLPRCLEGWAVGRMAESKEGFRIVEATLAPPKP